MERLRELTFPNYCKKPHWAIFCEVSVQKNARKTVIFLNNKNEKNLIKCCRFYRTMVI